MPKRILIIDDDKAIRDAFTHALEDTSFEVDVAVNGEEGIEKEKAGKFNLIYLDLKMPGINGVETLREIRKIDADVPVYIVTAFYKEFFDQLKAVKEDNIDFEIVAKPIGSEQILSLTNGILIGPVVEDQ